MYKKESNDILVLDVGTEEVKGLLVKKKEGLVVISRSFDCPIDWYGVFDGRRLEEDVMKKSILEGVHQIQGRGGRVPALAIISPPPNILRAQVIFYSLERKNSKQEIQKREEKAIIQTLAEKTKEKITKIFGSTADTTVADIDLLTAKITGIAIDGYNVLPHHQFSWSQTQGFLPENFSLVGFNGRKLDFSVLVVFSHKKHFNNFRALIKGLSFKESTFFHEAQSLISYKGSPEAGIFVDIGGDITQVFVVKAGQLQVVCQFEEGGKNFSKVIAQELGLEIQRAKVLKHRYSNGELSRQSQKKIQSFLGSAIEAWFKKLKQCLAQANILLPSDIILFGGGSLLKGMKEVLKKGDWKPVKIERYPKVKFYLPKQLSQQIQDQTGLLRSPQYIPSMLLSAICANRNFNF